MFSSFQIARIAGIPLRIHVLFVVVVLALLAQAGAAGGAVRAVGVLVFLAILFGSVLVHELGHALVARRFGARVLDITLWPLGGLARMTNMPERPKPELWVALAGPAVNLFIWALAALLGGEAGLRSSAGGGTVLDSVASVNAALAIFNLVPAFPMDGGRALRAFLARTRSWLVATEMAVRVGRWFTLIGLVLAWMSPSILFLPVLLIAVFLWLQGSAELRGVRARHGADPLERLFGRAFAADPETRGPVSRNGGPHSPPEPGPGEGSPSDIDRELEKFHGRLDEFFRRTPR